MNSKGLAQLAYEKGMSILAASESFEEARGAGRLGHGYLTYALVEEGLKTPQADTAPRDGQVYLREWLDYAVRRVPNMQAEAQEKRRLRRPGTIVAEGQHPRVFYRREMDARTLLVMQAPTASRPTQPPRR